MLAKVNCAAVNGLSVIPVSVEVNATKGMNNVFMVGLPDNAVRESRMRVFRP